jgi:phenylacetate-CoA ligase
MYQPDVETMAREELEKLQLARLRRTVAHIAEHAPHYFEHLGRIPAEAIQSLEEGV